MTTLLPCPSKRGRRVEDVLVSPHVHEYGMRVASKVSSYYSADHTVALSLETWSSTIGRLSESLCPIDLVASKLLPRNKLPRNSCLGIKDQWHKGSS